MTLKLTYDSVDYDAEIVSGEGGLNMDHAMVGETLTIDTLTVRVITDTAPAFNIHGAGLLYTDTTLIGKYYLFELHRTGPKEYEMYFCSAIRLLDQSNHPGGLYTGQAAEDVIDDILGSIVSYTIDPVIQDIQVYGYLPYASRRGNLQMLLMAVGAAIKNASDGSLIITELTDTVAGVFDTDRVFIGGSVIDKNPATCVQVTEHNYLETTEEIELFNDSTITSETVVFTEPYHDLEITGGTITASGVNFCTFTGSGAVVITGQRYTHVTRIITEGTAPTGIDSDVIKRVTSNTLLTPNNAAIVAEKLFDYVSVAQSIKQEVIFGTERPADVVSVINPYTSVLEDACLKFMQLAFGKTEIRAMCEFLVDYVPPGATAGYENYVVLTGSGTWTVPAGVTRIRTILVGGGDGGAGGNNGTNTSAAALPQPGAGGIAGVKGLSALIFEINLTVTPASEYIYDCGAGGTGGAAGSAGADGEETTFGALSSSTGRRYTYGYSEPKSSQTLGGDGEAGVAGGNGNNISGNETGVTYDGVTYSPGSNGSRTSKLISGTYVWAYEGGGGGAAAGSNGSNGGNGSFVYQYSHDYATHGDGGSGANAADGADATNYGQGGNGGHGGGGGGFRAGNTQAYQYETYAGGGVGGTGGFGGNGGPGVIIIYY